MQNAEGVSASHTCYLALLLILTNRDLEQRQMCVAAFYATNQWVDYLTGVFLKQFKKNQPVRISGLKETKYNGQLATVLGYKKENKRFMVDLVTLFKKINVKVASVNYGIQ